ncbi:MAG TPA: ATP-binding protein [Saprospiraceae bacterium]|nr:ATP-binding protein [Saprospiraceae bacterium]HPI07165.1 ATP-binding protein [Saprospiraceae bacterium]
MNIRTKLTLRFSAIVATILVAFSLAVYVLSEDYRKEEFYARLESRAITTARLFVTVREVDENMLRIIDKNSIHAMFQERVLIFNPDDKLIYSSLDDLDVPYSSELLKEIRKKEKVEYTIDDVEQIGILYKGDQGDFVAISSAYDRFGRSKLQNLRNVLFTGLFVGILIIVLAGAAFAGQVLQPLARINAEVSNISAGNLSLRIDEGNRHDEIAQLAMNFNDMLHRLESAFEVQQQFVSNASHEMRNPLAAITTQLQLILDKKRTPEEYEQAMQSMLDDTQTLVELTNGLLTLAQSGIEKQRFQFGAVRVDEVLFLAQNELGKAHPDYHFIIEYETFPEDESQLTIPGNEQLLKTAFLNLMDNACKFSPDRTVRIRVAANLHAIDVSFSDCGIGVPEEEQELIFNPFYRSSNVQSAIKGHGIGLSLCRRILQLHNSNISIRSSLGTGSCFAVQLPY